MKQFELVMHSLDEYVSAVADYHEALLLVEEMKQRVVNAVEANTIAGLSKPDPLKALEDVAVNAIERALTTNGTGHAVQIAADVKRRTKNSPRNSPGMTKKAVYDALPGDVRAIMKRTGLSGTQVYAAAADLAAGNLIERHGSRGNTTYVVKGEKKDWDAKQFAGIYMNK
jgi:hypothetical protein